MKETAEGGTVRQGWERLEGPRTQGRDSWPGFQAVVGRDGSCLDPGCRARGGARVLTKGQPGGVLRGVAV